MPEILLYQPEIPPNTGNIMRLCANTGFKLHLIRPLGFSMDEKSLRRAGLDYRDWAEVSLHDSLQDCLDQRPGARVLALTTKGKTPYHQVDYQPTDLLLFGPETRGLPPEVLQSLPAEQTLRLPMQPGSRSLNLSNTCAILVYHAWHQLGFPDAQLLPNEASQ